MKTLIVALFVTLFIFGCNAQEQPGKGDQKSEIKKEKQNLPNESWTVKKEVDENGNVIGYDSTYTWTYTNPGGDSLRVDADSIIESFRAYFDQQMPLLWGENFMDPMFGDSLHINDFFAEDYFHKHWKEEFYDMDKMFMKMDSLRNLFFDRTMPALKEVPSPKKNGKDR